MPLPSLPSNSDANDRDEIQENKKFTNRIGTFARLSAHPTQQLPPQRPFTPARSRTPATMHTKLAAVAALFVAGVNAGARPAQAPRAAATNR